jgi:hypothetical protein
MPTVGSPVYLLPELLNPAVHRGCIDHDPALRHQVADFSARQRVSAISPHREEDQIPGEPVASERITAWHDDILTDFKHRI